MAKKYVVTTGKGGIAKSATAVALCSVFKKTYGFHLDMVDVDEENKLQRFLGSKVSAIKLPSKTAGAISKSILMAVWDLLGPKFRSDEPMLLDLGGNLDRHFLEWARSSQLADVMDHQVVFVVPVMPDRESIAHAHFMLTTAPLVFEGCHLVLLEVRANPELTFKEVAEKVPGYKALMSIEGVVHAQTFEYPTTLWKLMDAKDLTFAQALDIGTPPGNPEEVTKAAKIAARTKFAQTFGLLDEDGNPDVLLAGREITDLTAWARATTTELLRILEL